MGVSLFSFLNAARRSKTARGGESERLRACEKNSAYMNHPNTMSTTCIFLFMCRNLSQIENKTNAYNEMV